MVNDEILREKMRMRLRKVEVKVVLMALLVKLKAE